MTTTNQAAQDLQAMMKQTLESYELAQATRLRTQAGQGRMAAAIQEVEQAARTLLEKAGLAHIAGVPFQPDKAATSACQSDERLAVAFADAKLAYQDLPVALLHLAEACLEDKIWSGARWSLQPLLENPNSALYVKAQKLLAKTYLEANQHSRTTGDLTGTQELQNWLVTDQNHPQFLEQICEAYYQTAHQAIKAQNWSQAAQNLGALQKLNPTYRDTNQWLSQYPPLAWWAGPIKEFEIPYVVNTPPGREVRPRFPDNYLYVFDSCRSIEFSPNGRTLYMCYDFIFGLNQKGDDVIPLISIRDIVSFACSLDGSLFATGNTNGEINVWDVKTREQLLTLHGPPSAVKSMAFSPNGDWLAASRTNNNTILLWNVKTRKDRYTLREHTAPVLSLAFSSDRSLLASASADGTVKLWKQQTEQKTSAFSFLQNNAPIQVAQELRGHGAAVESVAFSPDGNLLASGSHDKTVKLWEMKTGQLGHTLQGHTGYVHSVAFSPDGGLLASGSADNTIKLWEVKTGQLLHTLYGQGDSVKYVAFSSNWLRLASLGHDGKVKLWQPPF